jgi:hypothetical protein
MAKKSFSSCSVSWFPEPRRNQVMIYDGELLVSDTNPVPFPRNLGLTPIFGHNRSDTRVIVRRCFKI